MGGQKRARPNSVSLSAEACVLHVHVNGNLIALPHGSTRNREMNLRAFAHDYFLLRQQPRVSPLSHSANLLTFALLAIGVTASLATKFIFASLPNVLLLVIAVLILDVLIQFAPPAKAAQRAQTILYGLLYLLVTCVCGVFAAYAMQRLTLPLQDGFL